MTVSRGPLSDLHWKGKGVFRIPNLAGPWHAIVVIFLTVSEVALDWTHRVARPPAC